MSIDVAFVAHIRTRVPYWKPCRLQRFAISKTTLLHTLRRTATLLEQKRFVKPVIWASMLFTSNRKSDTNGPVKLPAFAKSVQKCPSLPKLNAILSLKDENFNHAQIACRFFRLMHNASQHRTPVPWTDGNSGETGNLLASEVVGELPHIYCFSKQSRTCAHAPCQNVVNFETGESHTRSTRLDDFTIKLEHLPIDRN